MSYLNKNPRQRAVMLFPNPAAPKLWYTGEIENRREQEAAQQVQQGTFDSLSANTVLMVTRHAYGGIAERHRDCSAGGLMGFGKR